MVYYRAMLNKIQLGVLIGYPNDGSQTTVIYSPIAMCMTTFNWASCQK